MDDLDDLMESYGDLEEALDDLLDPDFEGDEDDWDEDDSDPERISEE